MKCSSGVNVDVTPRRSDNKEKQEIVTCICSGCGETAHIREGKLFCFNCCSPIESK